jgi:hypothetical protein
VAYNYNITKATKVYAFYTMVDNDGNGTFMMGGSTNTITSLRAPSTRPSPWACATTSKPPKQIGDGDLTGRAPSPFFWRSLLLPGTL